jgi:hypothetical protein
MIDYVNVSKNGADYNTDGKDHLMQAQSITLDAEGNTPTVADINSGLDSVAAYQSTMTASTYQITPEANSPQYVILSSNEK